MTAGPARPYAALRHRLANESKPGLSHEQRMSIVVDVLWPALSCTGVSWLGFYALVGEEMVLRARRDKPACSPIGMHGACGRACLEKTSIIVNDVADLGAAYVACDPRDLSELVIPLFTDEGDCWGVFDADSFERGAFEELDAFEFHRMLAEFGLTSGELPRVLVV